MHDGEIWIAGVDGCRGGWMVVLHPLERPDYARAQLVNKFAEVLALPEQPRVIAVDIPIGLPERSGAGGRRCDALVRKAVGPRYRSVFSVPARIVFAQSDVRSARDVAPRFSDPPRSITEQLWNIRKSILDVDELMTPTLQGVVHECHPELIFWRLNKRSPVEHPKKSASGSALREFLLIERGYVPALWRNSRYPTSVAGRDDIIDACAAAACAADIERRQAVRFPDNPPRDAKGLRMEIWG
ncbi:MAG: DUF429 domain-containing protein [Hyphomicrobium sp.]